MIVVVDYGMGNHGSIVNMLKKVGHRAITSSKSEDIKGAKKLVLPGVGAFDSAMTKLNGLGIIPALNQKVVQEKTPTLGICLGMQLLSQKSEEGILPGLGWIEGETIKFKFDSSRSNFKVPHMGWNNVKVTQRCALFEDMYDDPRFYFVHSYHVVCSDETDVLTRTCHGIEFTSSVVRGNIAGVQFHPEKSHKFGMRLLKNFAEKF